MDKKILIVIALIGIGLWALPQTMSLFAGQHSFVNIDATGNQIDCVKCHGDVQAELTGSGISTITNTESPHADFKCEYCHRIEVGSSSGDNAYGLIPYVNETGSKRRYMIVSVADMENGVPTSINGSDIFNSKTIAGVTLISKGNISMVTTDITLNVGDKSSWKLKSTYNPTTSLPYDTNSATMNSGLDLSKATVSTSGTVNLTNAGSRAINPGSSYHAASLVSCMECHGGYEPMGHYSRVADGTENGGVADCSNCHYGSGSALTGESGTKMVTLYAGGFGLTGRVGDTGTTEAHTEFLNTEDGITKYKDDASNGACVACHTHVAVDITYNKPTIYQFEVDMTGGSTETLDAFTSGGSTYTYSGN